VSELRIAPDFVLDTERFKDEGLRGGIFASPGAGKGYLLGVLIEELIDAGYPCVMVDPESELWTFREIGALVLGGPHGHVPLAGDAAAVIEYALHFCLDSATPVVFDLADLETDSAIREMFEAIAGVYWRLVSTARTPSVFALTEAHVIAPQAIARGEGGASKLPAILSRGRKRGVIPLLETQRIADVANAVISHCNVRFIGRIDFDDDFKRVAKGMPGVTFADVQGLNRGSFYVPRLVDGPIHVRERRVTHGAVTPCAGEVKLRREDAPATIAAIAERLASLLEPEPEPAAAPARRAAKTRAPTAAAPDAAVLKRERDDAILRQERLEAEANELSRRIEQAEARAYENDDELERVAAFRAALIEFLALDAPGEGGGRGYPGDDHVVRLIHAHAPAGAAGAVLQPVEKLRADYLERSAHRLVEVVRSLDADEREALLFLLTQNSFVTINSITRALSGHDGGGQRNRWSRVTQTLKAKGLVLIGGTGGAGRRHNIDGFVAVGLAPHNPTADELAAVRDRALYVLQEGS
jgi:Helicase HerA, central domain